LEGTEAEYRRRHSRKPPKGLDKWFNYAMSKRPVFTDEFDMITKDLQPFWQMSPQRLLEAVNHVATDEQLALRKCGFT
jgi:hypothetical protein